MVGSYTATIEDSFPIFLNLHSKLGLPVFVAKDDKLYILIFMM